MPTLTRTTLDVLRDARDLLTPPERWTKGSLARTASDGRWRGSPTTVAAHDAACFCALGGLMRAAGINETTGYADAKYAQYRDGVAAVKATLKDDPRAGTNSIPSFNDDASVTHGDILAAFDKAIATQVKDA